MFNGGMFWAWTFSGQGKGRKKERQKSTLFQFYSDFSILYIAAILEQEVELTMANN